MGYIVTLLVTAFACWVSERLISGISFSSTFTLIIAAAVFGLVNMLIRPAAIILSLPLTILTLGLFILVVNAAMFALTSAVIPGMTVASFGAALMGAIIVSLVSWAAGRLVAA